MSPYRVLINCLTGVAIVGLFLTGCGPAPTPEEVVVATTVVETVVVPPTPEPEKSEIRIGIPNPFSGSTALSGEAAMRGVTMALEEMGWQVAGHPIKLFPADNACNPEMGVTAFRKLVDVDKVDLILGSGCSGTDLSTMPLLAEVGVAQLSSTSTNAKIPAQSGPGRNEWEFHLNAVDVMLGDAFAPYIAAQVKSIAILAFSDDFGKGVVAAYESRFPAAGVEVKLIDYYERGASDYRPLLLKVKESGAEAILITTTEQEAITFLRQVKEMGLDVKVFSQGVALSRLFYELTKKEPGLGEGITEASWWGVGYDPDLDNRYQERWGTPLTANGAFPYYSMYVAKAAIEIADATGTVNRQTIRDGLAQVSIDLPIGHIEFNDYHQAEPNMSLVTIKDGKLVQVAVLPTKYTPPSE